MTMAAGAANCKPLIGKEKPAAGAAGV